MQRNLQLREHPLGRVGSALQLEAEHASEVSEELARPRVLGMALEPRVVHARHRPLLLEELRHRQRGRALLTVADAQRLQPPLQEETGVGIERATQVVERPLHFADPRRGSHHRAGDDVAMAIQVLGRAVQDQIEPMSQRPEGERRREGVVDDRD